MIYKTNRFLIMAGLPHYTNSQAGSKRYEPVYPNLFEVNLLPPATVSGGAILLEHVNSISGLDNEKGQAAVEQKYKQATRSYADTNPEATTVDLTIQFSLNLNDGNELYAYKTLRDWKRLIYNPLTGEMGLKKDYVGTIIVTNFNRAGDIFWQRTFYEAFITGPIPAIDLDITNGEPAVIDVAFRSDWWSEDMV